MIGPAKKIALGGGKSADLYLLRFGDDGRLESPQTAQMAVDAAAKATDVFVFSHGWNTVYRDALADYERFAKGFIAQRAEHGLPTPPDYAPVLIGVIWPSAWFVFGDAKGPKIAGGPGGLEAAKMLAEVTKDLSPEARSEIFEIVDGSVRLNEAEATRVAKLMKPLWTSDPSMGAPNLKAILAAWQRLDGGDSTPFTPDNSPIGRRRGSGDGQVAAAGGGRFDPVTWARMASVWQIKARAGEVGKKGVGPLLVRLLKASQTSRVHLVGHSFGARVMLSAIARSSLPRNVHSLLLLQPAVNRWCFAAEVLDTGRKGGYAEVLDRVARPIISTWSTHDFPLHEAFHLFVRGDSLGEINAAAVGDTERYGALGGYGPGGLSGSQTLKATALKPGDDYALNGSKKVVVLDGSGEVDGKVAIPSHGEVNSPVTWWMLHQLVAK